ncbi:MAG: hypothetical protein EBU90_22535 [Proteobacteria bacterium]|nr:hypothetical protein [Pseudomonadota bacterium]
MSANNSVGNFSLNTVNLRKPIKFPDGTTQSTASTGGESSLAYYNDTLVSYFLSQPVFTHANIYPQNIGPGVYIATIYLELVGSATSIDFNYFKVAILGASTLLAQDFTQNFTLAGGDNTWKNVNLTFVVPVQQTVSIEMESGITSGPFTSGTPFVTIINYILTKVANYP